jgi:TonB family protein
VAGIVNIGLGITPQGTVGNGSRVIAGPPALIQPAAAAIYQWKFQPNVVRGQATFSRVRALVRFNADGTTAVDLAPANLPDNFGDPGTPANAPGAFPRSKPEGSVACTGGSDASLNSQPAIPASSGAAAGATAEASLPQAGAGGVGGPVCISCPQPAYSQAARDARTNGVVELRVVISAEGRVTNIQVVRGPGMGLEENAVAAVRTWRFRPATGPNGTAVAVVAPLSVKFALF